MKDDVRKYIYGAITVFLVGVMTWISIVYVSACGVTLTCNRGAPSIDRTPIPTLIPATLPSSDMFREIAASSVVGSDSCRVAAVDFIGAWAVSDAKEADPFYFVDKDGKNCEATFAEIQPLFTETGLRGSDSLACVSCHSGDLTVAPAQLDLSSYAGIMVGSRRENDKKKGTDILGDGDWKASLLYDFLMVGKANVPGHEQAVIVDSFFFVGKPFVKPVPTTTPKP